MNRLRHPYLQIAPALEPNFTTGRHEDEQGLAASYLAGGHRLGRSGQFLVNTPTIVAMVDAALAPSIVVLVLRAAEAATTVAVAAVAVAFLVAAVRSGIVIGGGEEPAGRGFIGGGDQHANTVDLHLRVLSSGIICRHGCLQAVAAQDAGEQLRLGAASDDRHTHRCAVHSLTSSFGRLARCGCPGWASGRARPPRWWRAWTSG
jgi:hypothetical protein